MLFCDCYNWSFIVPPKNQFSVLIIIFFEMLMNRIQLTAILTNLPEDGLKFFIKISSEEFLVLFN